MNRLRFDKDKDEQLPDVEIRSRIASANTINQVSTEERLRKENLNKEIIFR